VQRATLSGPLFTIVGIAYFVDLFLRWAPPGGSEAPATFSGWDIQLVIVSGEAVVALILVDLVRSTGVWRTAGSSLLTVFLAAFTAVLGVSGLIHLHWGGFYRLKFGSFGYGAWVGLILLLALAAGAVVRLEEHGAHFGRREGRVGSGT
jgi:hypothetical protein